MPDELVPRLLTGIERALVMDLLEAAKAEDAAAAERAAGSDAPAAIEVAPSAAPTEAAVLPAASAAAEPVPSEAKPDRPTRSRLVAIALIALPLILAAAAWLGARAAGTLPETVEGRRSLVLALGLIGPATAVLAAIARLASPRLLGLVLLSSIVAMVVAVRALLP